MKIETELINKVKKGPDYPVVMEHIDSGYLVLFIAKEVGIVVKEGPEQKASHTYLKGHCSTIWVACTDKAIWKEPDYNVEVTFS